MFANVVFIAFLLISAIVFGFLVLLVRQIKKDGQLSQEKLTRLSAFLFMPFILIFALVFYGLSSWRADLKYQQSRVEVEKFVNRVYPPLAESQQSLLQSISHMRKLQESIEPLRDEHINHAGLLDKIATEWRDSQQTLYTLYAETDKEIRHAWISYKTMDQQDVLDKFNTKAVKLNDKITKLDRDYQVGVRGAKDELIKSIDAARRLLEDKKRRTKQKKKKSKAKSKKQIKGKNKDNQEPIVIVNFTERTTAKLLAFLSRLDDALADEVLRLEEDIRIARQRHEEVRLYLKDNPDLQLPLSKVMNGWQQLQRTNHQYKNQILYALEAEYLARKLGLSKNDPSVSAMHKTLQSKIPSIVRKARMQRVALERSYSIK